MAYQKIFTSKEFIERTKVAAEKKTLYILGCFGAPMGYGNNRKRYETNYDYNKQPERTAMIETASDDTFGFDCVCLVKGIGWNWVGDTTKEYGGAKYASNGIEDMTIAKMRSVSEFSTDFSKIVPGEVLFFEDNSHVGIYIGDGMAIECTPRWKNGVQYTVVQNVSNKAGNGRKWYGHGKLPWIDYEAKETPEDEEQALINKWEAKAYECMKDTIAGHYGSGECRKEMLFKVGEGIGADGFEFWQNVQDLVNVAVNRYNWKTDFRLAPKSWSKSLAKHEAAENCWVCSNNGYTKERAEALVKMLKEKGYDFSIEVR